MQALSCSFVSSTCMCVFFVLTRPLEPVSPEQQVFSVIEPLPNNSELTCSNGVTYYMRYSIVCTIYVYIRYFIYCVLYTVYTCIPYGVYYTLCIMVCLVARDLINMLEGRCFPASVDPMALGKFLARAELSRGTKVTSLGCRV